MSGRRAVPCRRARWRREACLQREVVENHESDEGVDQRHDLRDGHALQLEQTRLQTLHTAPASPSSARKRGWPMSRDRCLATHPEKTDSGDHEVHASEQRAELEVVRLEHHLLHQYVSTPQRPRRARALFAATISTDVTKLKVISRATCAQQGRATAGNDPTWPVEAGGPGFAPVDDCV